MSIEIGIDGKLYFGPAGSIAPVEITSCRGLHFVVRQGAHPGEGNLTIVWEMDVQDCQFEVLKTVTAQTSIIALRVEQNGKPAKLEGDFKVRISDGPAPRFTAEPYFDGPRIPKFS